MCVSLSLLSLPCPLPQEPGRGSLVSGGEVWLGQAGLAPSLPPFLEVGEGRSSPFDWGWAQGREPAGDWREL